MTPGALLDEFVAVLEREADAAARLLKVLEREHAALAAGEIDAIGEITAVKRLEIAALEEAGRIRAEFIAAARIGPDRPGIERFVGEPDGHRQSGATQSWHRLRALAGACDRQNRINGGIILAGQRQAQLALAVLQGQQPDGVRYGPDGAALQLPPSTTLATA